MYYVLEQHGSATVSAMEAGSFNLLLEHGTWYNQLQLRPD
jgi:hypothetical protein